MRLLIFIFSLIFSTSLWSQSGGLHIPLNLQPAYENQTRSYDGNPGVNYWINRADYKMDVSFDPQSHLIKGKAVITYFNQSPDSLSEIVLRLYPNIFRKGSKRDWPVNPADLIDGVQIDHLSLNAEIQDLDSPKQLLSYQGTNVTILLPRPMPPKSELVMGLNWNYLQPEATPMRMGKYDSSSYFIAYWYPQIAAYDDIDGWDTYNYGGLQEFYNDANNYDVKISVPAGFVVWATGILQNPEQLLPPTVLQRYQQGMTSDSTIHILDSSEVDKKFMINPRGQAWNFKSDQTPDFAFAISNHYLWDMNSLVVDSISGRRVTVQTAYKKESADFFKVARIARASLNYFSNELPGVPFPYPNLTVFNGGGGMEFPMMVNDGSASKWSSTVHVTSHEIAHSYFPFFMGTNERKYAFMDEGWAVMLPYVLQNRLDPKYDPIARSIGRYNNTAGTEMDIPMSVPSIVYGSNAYRPAYRNAAYTRPALAYLMLQKILGEKRFQQGMQTYIQRWQRKHPIPYDFFFTFNQIADQDLSWFWKPWFLEFGYPDLAIKDVRQTKTGSEITVQKIGSLPLPIYLEIELKDGRKKVIEKNPAIWSSNDKQFILSDPTKNIKLVRLGNDHIPDVNLKNNIWTEK